MGQSLNQLQLLQQNVQNMVMQKQQLEGQLTEFDSALQELKSTTKAYRLIGKIMIASSPEILMKNLEEQKEVALIRLKNFQRQEEKMRQNMEALQKKALAELGEKNEWRTTRGFKFFRSP